MSDVPVGMMCENLQATSGYTHTTRKSRQDERVHVQVMIPRGADRWSAGAEVYKRLYIGRPVIKEFRCNFITH